MRALIVLIVSISAGLFLAFMGTKMAALNSRFDGRVTRVQGTLDELIGNRGFIRSSRSQIRIATYHYETLAGRQQSSDSISLETWNLFHISHAVPVKYLPENPAICRIDFPQVDKGYRDEVWIAYGAGFVIFVLGLILSWKLRHA